MIPTPIPMIRFRFECLLCLGALTDAVVGTGLCGVLSVGGAAAAAAVHTHIYTTLVKLLHPRAKTRKIHFEKV